MSKAKVKLGLDGKKPVEKIQFSRQVVTGITGNVNYTTPVPAMTVVTTAANELETAYNATETARDVLKAKVSAQNDKEATLNTILGKVGSYVEPASDGDETKIRSAGLDIRAKASPATAPAKPTGLSATIGDKQGEIDLAWDKVKGAKSYVVQQSPDPIVAKSWEQVNILTKSKIVVPDLAPGTNYWFRVAAVGTAGIGAWSDPVMKMAV